MTGWGIHRLRDMVGSRFNFACDGERWYRAVPLPYRGNRIKPALAVLFGYAYAVKWPELGEWEALHEPEWPDEKIGEAAQ
ncbi:MAG: hypothetical protein LCH99_30700 [Proteobacteria bacterium]|nr:hypothetical protein [Pseudomonadota bacterium]